jgi:predicted dehydrogenase
MALKFGTTFFPRREALLREAPDAVVVTSENAYHTEDVLAAAREKVHVLCEKPIATTMKDARRQISACRDAGVSLSIAFPVRYCPPIIRLKASVDAGDVGKVVGAATTNHGSMPGGWFTKTRFSGGGAVMDHTPHVADLLRWILKDEVAEVYAECDRLIHKKLPCDDVGMLSLRFSRGTIATLDTSWSRVSGFPTWGDVTLRLWGERGLVTADAFSQQFTLYGEKTRFVGWGDSADLGLIADFADNIRNRRPPSITGEDGMKAMEIALGAYRSARTHKPVRLPLEPA